MSLLVRQFAVGCGEQGSPETLAPLYNQHPISVGARSNTLVNRQKVPEYGHAFVPQPPTLIASKVIVLARDNHRSVMCHLEFGSPKPRGPFALAQ